MSKDEQITILLDALDEALALATDYAGLISSTSRRENTGELSQMRETHNRLFRLLKRQCQEKEKQA